MSTHDIQIGMTLSSEEHGPRRLVQLAAEAEDAGFDFVSISDHYHPWVSEQGHSPFVWSVLGGIARATDRIHVGVGVTCPTMRIHPAVVAQAVATTGCLLDGRFTWGVGSGEALNEHVTGARWPAAGERLSMLREAVDVVRRLLAGGAVTHRGDHYTVENAIIYDRPEHDIPILVSAFGPEAAKLAAEIGDGLWMTGPGGDAVEPWRDAGGTGPVWTQLTLCYDTDPDRAAQTAAEKWPNSALKGQLAQDLPTPAHFADATAHVDAELMAEQLPCGPDPEPTVEAVRNAVEAGATHVYLHQIGDDQESFLEWWKSQLGPRIRDAVS